MSIKITSLNVEFFKSCPSLKGCPEGQYPEFAFIGRSNVGKSSLINMLANNRKLAHTSGQPGKTKLINYYLATFKEQVGNEENIRKIPWFLVDLPGYGFAKTSKAQRGEFSSIISDYVFKRQNLTCLFVLIDSRLEPQQIDIKFITLLGQQGVPFCLVFTKIDKISSNSVNSNIEKFKATLLEQWEEFPKIFLTSAEKKQGREELLNFVKDTIRSLKS
ncbi:MAG TPA: ribosome biogenesis GTP-binding protein YihA/YsxC [Bacteroidales bacterium]|nr:ribosome biogenesis GTP-binding protein YihA/YsxC [Bacteroidales bacterium]